MFVIKFGQIGTHANDHVYWGGEGFLGQAGVFTYALVQAKDQKTAILNMLLTIRPRLKPGTAIESAEFDSNLLRRPFQKEKSYPSFAVKVKEVSDHVMVIGDDLFKDVEFLSFNVKPQD